MKGGIRRTRVTTILSALLLSLPAALAVGAEAKKPLALTGVSGWNANPAWSIAGDETLARLVKEAAARYVGREITALQKMTVVDLRGRYAEVFGETTTSRHKQFLVRRILWRMQANAEGGLSERALRRAEELANDADLRLIAPKGTGGLGGGLGRTVIRRFSTSNDRRLPMPGSVITREYRGRTVTVTVLDTGFEHEGTVYRSLTAVAHAVTGTHWNGYHFFRCAAKGGRS